MGKVLESQKQHKRDASNGFYQLDARFPSPSIKRVGLIKSVKIRPDETWYLQACCKLLKQQYKTPWQSSWIKPVDNLQQTCYDQAGASAANASRWQLGKKPAADWLQIVRFWLPKQKVGRILCFYLCLYQKKTYYLLSKRSQWFVLLVSF